MDYKEKYEQALENIKKIKAANKDNKSLVDFIEYKYPELKESEDEKIRKALIQHIKYKVSVISGWRKEELIAWLKKQGKVKHTCRNCKTFQDLHQNCPYSPIYQCTDLTEAHKRLDDETNCEFWLEKQYKQSSAKN